MKGLHGILIVLFLLGLAAIICFFVSQRQTLSKGPLQSRDLCPEIVRRKLWNATKAKNKIVLHVPVSYVAIHHTTGAQCYTAETCLSMVADWQKRHMTENGWDDIGFNFLVGSSGYTYQGRGWFNQGVYCPNYDNQSIGIGIIGDYSDTKPSGKAFRAMKYLLECGVRFGLIEKNYTLLIHPSLDQIETFMLPLNESHPIIFNCSSQSTRSTNY